ncbi:MAG: PrsW family intramembrane metalloprotease [Aulosira sp. ZfuVER01]|nr:PrsW family glutamic-type intramembrane protease [Aulosira sp. ZfuVER01]MDZ8001190.1 PrsW family glutamic-type intramembrane protease [Aulosira sp. DedVER01a]MDZ8050847.1 PrsW family glutamic-type intramembrane protease [Aulosira sp. ZfuCHP01]
MEQSDPREFARQGNIEAIAVLIKRALQTQRITSKINLKDGCLQILLVSDTIPNEQALVNLIRTELQLLNADFAKTVRIYGRELGSEIPAWVQEFPLKPISTNNSQEITSLQSSTTGHKIASKPSISSPRSSVDFLNQRIDALEFLQTLRTFRFSAVVPYREALSPGLYGHTSVKLLLFFGLFPLAVSFIFSQIGFTVGLEQTAWVLGVYYASIWGVVLQNLIRPKHFSWREIFKCVLFTVFVGIPLLLFIQKVPIFSFLYAATDWGLIPRLIGFVLGVGVLEEVCKALPIYLFFLRVGKLSDPLTLAFYGTMSGLGFAISEGVVYSVVYAFGLVQGEIDFGAYVLTNTIRFVCLPLFHAIWAGIVGYFLGLASINPSRQVAIIVIGIAIAAMLHGLYDTFSGGFLGLTVMAFSILLFVAYLQHSQQMIEDLKQAELGRRNENNL